MRRSVSLAIRLLVALALAVPIVAAPTPATAARRFTIQGSGYGHGIGMSQYGAHGYGLLGWTYDDILARYYQKSTLSTKAMKDAWVNIDSAFRPNRAYSGRASWSLAAVDSTLAVWSVSDANDRIELPKDTAYRFTSAGTGVRVTRVSNGAIAKSFTTDVWVGAVTSGHLIEVQDQSTSRDGAYHADGAGWNDVRYRGRFLIRRNAGTSTRVDAINRVPMQGYLYGVVPREMPASWHAEGLKAQATAARSYAFADVSNDRILASTIYSQVYKGHSRLLSTGEVDMHEDSRSNAAVNATNNKVITYGGTQDGNVVKAYFFSSSGGHTANVEDVWVTNTGHEPFLRGVNDLVAEQRAGSPYLSWGSITMDGALMASKLRAAGTPDVPASPNEVVAATIEGAASGHARYVTFTFTNGAKVRVSGDRVRSAFGLRSTRFRILGFPISRISGSDRYATSVAVSKASFSSTAPVAVVASGDLHADALVGSALAGAKRGTLLLTASSSLPSGVRAELTRLKPAKVYVVGGTRSVSSGVESSIKSALPSATVVRLAERDRYLTSVRVAREIGAVPSTAMIVNGDAWADAASASAVAYAKGYPILLTPAGSLPSSVRAYLAEARPAPVVLGGTASVTDAVKAQAASATGRAAMRIAGPDRFSTSAALARWAAGQGFTFSTVYLASGRVFADALSGGVVAGKNVKPLVLTDRDAAPTPTVSLLREKRASIQRLVIIGGTATVSSQGQTSLDIAMSN